MRPVSQSRLSVFRECPFRYKLSSIDKLDGIYFSATAMEIGGYVHDALENYYKHNFVYGSSQNDILYYSYNNLKNVWDTTFTTEDFTKAYKCLCNHADWQTSYKPKMHPAAEDDIYSKKWHGIIDFFDTEMAIDWKTNKCASLSYAYRMQAQIYKWLIESKYNINLKHFHFFFLYPNEWRTVAFDKKKQQEVANDTINLWDAMQSCYDNDEFPKSPRTKSGCNGCPYNFYCKVLNYE